MMVNIIGSLIKYGTLITINGSNVLVIKKDGEGEDEKSKIPSKSGGDISDSSWSHIDDFIQKSFNHLSSVSPHPRCFVAGRRGLPQGHRLPPHRFTFLGFFLRSSGK